MRVPAHLTDSAESSEHLLQQQSMHVLFFEDSSDDFQVGIGVVALRRGTPSEDNLIETEVLLVRRAKPPEVGKWTFPGGSLELGKMLVHMLFCESNSFRAWLICH